MQGRSRRQRALVVGVLAGALALAAPPLAGAAKKGGMQAKITRQAQGIPTIEADSYKELGFGYGYAFAEDNVCTMADEYVTVRGERSRYFGPDAISPEGFRNLDSDFFFTRINDNNVVEKLIAKKPPLGPRPEVKQVVKGYVKGWNLFIEKKGDKIDDPRCAGQPWVQKIKPIDVYRRFHELALYASSGTAIDGIATAQPPGASPRPTSSGEVSDTEIADLGEALDFSDGGSNGWGFGKQGTKSKNGLVLINPHFPWDGPRRLYQANLIIPGKLHVSGASLYGVPFILIGHTENLSWMHPVSPAFRFVPFALQLAPGNPTSYIVDGQTVAMEADQVTVQALQPDGSLAPVSRTLYSSRYGPIFNRVAGQSLFGWSNDTAYALWDANETNLGRLMNHFFEVGRAQTTKKMLKILKKYEGIPWVHTVASDRRGKALYADIGSIPNVPDEKATGPCQAPLGQLSFPAFGLPVLDGSRSECALTKGPGAADKGLIGDKQLPHLFRNDYVANSNDSYWLSNYAQRLEGFDRIVGAERTQRNLRTRVGLLMILEQLGGGPFAQGAGKMTRKKVQELVFSDRHYLGELWRDDLVAYCNANPTLNPPGGGGPVDVSEACPVLAAWDLKVNLDSRGALLFARFVDRFGTAAARFATPFDVNDPLMTPRGLNTSDPNLESAFANAVTDLRNANIPLDAPWGDFHYDVRNGERIPIHGGEGGQGVFNAIIDRWTPGVGYDDISGGSSFVMVTEFNKKCPNDRSITTYSQSENPNSPHYSDQTRMFSQKKWVDPPFCEREVEKTAERTKTIRSR